MFNMLKLKGLSHIPVMVC